LGLRSRFIGGGIGLVFLIGGCGAQASPPAANSSAAGCVDMKAPHHAYVVVQHMSGAWMEACVGFGGGFIDGQTIMDRSGIEYQAQPVSSGKVVCQVDSEPSQFSECFPQNRPYWALFIDSGGRWAAADGGYTDVRLRDGDALGWHYVRAGDPAPTAPPLPRKV